MAQPRPKRFRRVRVPTLLQMESTECGAAALGIILAYHGRFVPLEELRVECRVSRDGSNALYVKKTAEKYGMIGRGFQMTVDELRELEPPFVVFWELNHFLVVEGFGRNRVYLSDPASGRRSVDERTFRDSYTGIVFQFVPGPTFQKGGQRPSTWRAILRRIRGASASVAYVVFAGLAVVACELVAATYNLVFVDQVLVEERRHWIRPLLLAMGLTVLFRLLSGSLQLGALRKLKLSLAMVHSARFLWHVLRLPIHFFQQRFTGDVSARVDSNSLVAELISGQLATTIVGLVMVVFYAAVVGAFDPRLAVVGVAIGSLNLVGIAAVSRSLADENLEIKQVRGRLFGTLTRAVQIIETIKAGSSEADILVRLTGYQARLTNSFQVVGAAAALLVVLPPLLLLATTAAVLWLGGSRVIDGLISVGALLSLQTLMVNFNRPFGDLVRLGSNVQSLQAELSRLDDVYQYRFDPLFEPRAALGPPDAEPPRRLSGHLELREVTFGYNHTIDEPLIKRFSLEIQPGSRVALVGASGSGKSTIGKLVAGLYRPWEGEILYDGRPIDAIPREVFTNQVALVDDQTFLFSGTIRDNLTLWDDTVPERDVVRAAIDAAIHRDVIHRKGGYLAGLAEGARNLSGGQRQRLEIARALIRDPALLILDEATSALDPITEALVDDHLRRRGATCLIIAHRLSTIRDCDEIIVLRQGRVIQRGTHDSLMADTSGFYHELQALGDDRDAPRASRGGEPRARSFGPPPSLNGAPSPPTAGPTGVNGRTSGGLEPARSGETAGEAATCPRRLPLTAEQLLEELGRLGETVTTAGNRPLPLDDAGAVWRVVSGQVDVFYVQPPELGQTRGGRRHLCRVEEGGSIFAIDGVRSEEQGGLLAVGAGLARLCKVPKAELVRLAFEPEWRRAVAEMIDDWVDRITRATEAGDPPRQCVWLDADEPRAVAKGQAIASRGRVVWVRPTAGRPRFAGRVRVPECAFGSRFPLSTHGWLSLDEDGEVRPCHTETLMEDGDPWVGLERFHQVMLDALAQARRRDRAIRHARLEHAGLRDDSVVATALAGLARLARPDTPEPSRGAADDRLVAACRVVAEAIGVEVQAPPLEEADDPLRVIARASGFRTRRVRLDGDWIRSDGGPLLAFLEADGRPVALLPAPGPSYVLVDPSCGAQTRVTEATARTLAPAAVMFTRTLRGGRPTIADLLRLGLPNVRGEFRMLAAMGVVCGLLGLLVPAVTSIVVDDLIPRADRPQLGILCGFLVAVGLAIAAFQAVQGFTLARIRGRLETNLLPAIWDRLFSLPTRFFGGEEAGDLALRAMGLARVIEVLTSTAVASLVVTTFSLFNLFILFFLNWRLALVALGLVAIVPLASFAVLPALWRHQRRIARAQGRISALLLVLLGGIARLRVAGAERRAFARWAERYRRQLDRTQRYQRLADGFVLFTDVWPLVVLMVVFSAVVWLGPDAPSTGEFVAFNLALGQSLAAVVGLGKGILPLLNGLEQFERCRPILEATPEGAELQGESVTLGGAIRLSHLSFRYSEDGPLVLDDVSLQVRPGEFVAVVGPSGSGKSTLLRLLLGFETPSQGVIAYDGRELATLDIQDVRRQIGVVLQDAQLLPGDIYSNIVGFVSQRTRDDAWQAAELAGLADDIEAMPMGIHTVIGEGGGGLSSGQRQRLIIARALAGRPKLLLLDEATSALDNRSQAHIHRSLHTRLRGVSRLAIAHRLSTVADADRIYVLSEGKVVQNGTYAQLIDEPGPFRDLARRQALV